jgi:hypothetical protein
MRDNTINLLALALQCNCFCLDQATVMPEHWQKFEKEALEYNRTYT